jgi:hypothetical protein
MQLPSRADHVGSLLRPVALREARAQHAAGTLAAEALRQVEDHYIRWEKGRLCFPPFPWWKGREAADN